MHFEMESSDVQVSSHIISALGDTIIVTFSVFFFKCLVFLDVAISAAVKKMANNQTVLYSWELGEGNEE